MNLTQFEVFVAIVDTGSFTEAAETVGLTQSAVSYALSKLEDELGVTLLERSRRGVTVTRIGEDVLQHARSILTQIEVVRQKTARERGLSVGKLRFGTVPNIPARMLTGIMRDFQHKYPDIEIVLFEGNARELMDWLETGVIDVGTVVIPETFTKTVQIVRAEFRVVLPIDHPLATQSSVLFEQVADTPLIGPKTEYTMVTAMSHTQDIAIPRLRYEVSSYNTIFAMVREQMGFSIMPSMMVDDTIEGIVHLPLEPRIELNVYMAANVHSPAIDAFLKNAADWAKEHNNITE